MDKTKSQFFLNDIERLRGFACILVLIQHIAWIVPMRFIHNILPFHLLVGSGGPFIFFAISGFVVTLSLRDKLEKAQGAMFLDRLRGAGEILCSFYKKRFFRIFPVASLVMFFTFVYLLISEDNFSWLATALRIPIEVFLGVYNYSIEYFQSSEKIHSCIGSFWTLAIEAQFYFLWPIFLLLFKNNDVRASVSLWTGCVILFIIQPACIHFFGFHYYSCYGTLPSLFLGSFLGFIYKKNDGECAVNISRRLTVCVTAILAMYIWYYPNSLDRICYSKIVLHLLSVALVAWCAYVKGSFDIPVIGKFFQYLGSRSYSFYAVQLIVASYVVFYTDSIYFSKNSLSQYDFCLYQLLIFFAVLFPVTEIMYRFVEVPLRKIGRE
jgi:peptidoglycan/LPS O-acetylase OafA/YrhL